MLRVFVYGTLKHGYWNHDRHMQGAVSSDPATVLGRLHVRSTGTPILEIPGEHVLATGTRHHAADAEAQRRFAGQAPEIRPHDKWVRVHGEVYTFNDTETRLAALDQLEEFVPGGESLYDRVLTWCGKNGAVAWTYVIPSHRTADDYTPAHNPANWDPRVEGLAVTADELE